MLVNSRQYLSFITSLVALFCVLLSLSVVTKGGTSLKSVLCVSECTLCFLMFFLSYNSHGPSLVHHRCCHNLQNFSYHFCEIYFSHEPGFQQPEHQHHLIYQQIVIIIYRFFLTCFVPFTFLTILGFNNLSINTI